MTLPVIGADCHAYLQHAAVYDGEPLPLILYPLPGERGSGPLVKVHYESYSDPLGEAQDVRHLWFNVLLSDDLLAPSGAVFAVDRSTVRTNLINIAMQHEDIVLCTAGGLITGLASTGHVLIHSIGLDQEYITVHLTTRLLNFAPVDPGRFNASEWVDVDTYDGIMTWDNSYWR